MTTNSAIVLGAGMAGVASALHLQARGWAVVLVDRREPGRETSYGNAGIIQSEAARPYAMPRDLRTLARIATRRTNDVHYHLGAMPRHAEPLARYWWHSAPRRHARISEAYASIIAHAAAEHDALIREAGAAPLVRRDGFRVLFRDREAMDTALADAETVRGRWGVRFQVQDPSALALAEPGLATGSVTGALHWLDPWTVSDPGALVAAYADLFVRRGGTLARGDAATLAPIAGGGWSVASVDGRLEAEAAVVALGPWSAELLRRFGHRVPMVRKRGYHRHYGGGATLNQPVMDAGFGYVLAPMAKGLRITTGAQLTGPDAPPTPVQLGRAEAAARGLLDLGTAVEADPWFGTRPCMPDMLPVIGALNGHRGLWAHFGHGHQGFTLGPVTGRLLAERMSGETPLVDVTPFQPGRR